MQKLIIVTVWIIGITLLVLVTLSIIDASETRGRVNDSNQMLASFDRHSHLRNFCSCSLVLRIATYNQMDQIVLLPVNQAEVKLVRPEHITLGVIA